MEWKHIHEWNRKIYRPNGEFEKKTLSAEDLWDKFKIKSGPKFMDACWSDVPNVWVDDVSDFILKVQEELKDKIEFTQIKEKFCQLTVYFTSADENTRKRMNELIEECIGKLIKKGVHPPRLGENNGK